MSGLIPRPFIDELLHRTDLVELVDGYVPLKKRGTSYTACCPFHNEKNPSFHVVAKKQFYHCFGCGASGNAISFIMNHLNQGFTDAIDTLAARIGLSVPKEGRTTDKPSQTPALTQLLKQVSQFYQQALNTTGSIAQDYLRKRQINPETALLFELGYASAGWHTLQMPFKGKQSELLATGMLIEKEPGKTYDRYRQRLMFPIHDRQGRIIAFGGRALEANQQPKYINSPETVLFQKSRELYGLYHVLKQPHPIPYIIIVEGYLDVIALVQHGITNAVATLGTATSTYHVQVLSKHTKQLIFCFDGDTAGRKAAWRALENSLPHLNAGLDASFIFLPEEHDPDSLVRLEGPTSFLARLQHATPLNRFFFDTLTQTINGGRMAGKSQLMNAAKPYLLTMADGPYKQLLIDELATLTHIEPHRINQLLTNNRTTPIKEPNKPIARTPLRVAIALLIQNPELFRFYSEAIPTNPLDSQKQPLLQALMQQIAQQPTITTAALVENWRDSPYFESLNKLAAWDHQVPEHALVQEFTDTVSFLEKQNHGNEIQKLIAKARSPSGLTATDRLTLQTMLKQRHQEIEE